MTPGPGRLALAASLAAATLQPGERALPCVALAIVDARDGTALGRWPLRPGETVAYTYTHSLEGLPAEELLVLGPDGELHLLASLSPQHGAGHVPRAPLRPAPGRPGWQRARLAASAPLTPFAVFTGDAGATGPRLRWRGRELPLTALGPRRHVEWRVESRCR